MGLRRSMRRPGSAAWPAGVAVPTSIAVVAVAVGVLTRRPAPWDVAWTAAAVSALAGMVVARNAATGPDRRRWTWWTAASAAWLAGQIAWDVYSISGAPASPNLADVGWWAFALLVI